VTLTFFPFLLPVDVICTSVLPLQQRGTGKKIPHANAFPYPSKVDVLPRRRSVIFGPFSFFPSKGWEQAFPPLSQMVSVKYVLGG